MSEQILTATIHKRYKNLAHMITEKAKRTGRMRRFDYERVVKPSATMWGRFEPITERQLLNGLHKAHIVIV
jgi:hypothetical protein